MPVLVRSAEHRASAERFEKFFKTIPAASPYADWKIIVLFYSALHYVEAFLATRTSAYRDHRLRDLEMGRHQPTRSIRLAYNKLKKAAHEARYEATPFRPGDVAEFQRYHSEVKQEMLRALSP